MLAAGKKEGKSSSKAKSLSSLQAGSTNAALTNLVENTGKIRASAETLRRNGIWVEAIGHAVVTKDSDELRADYIKYNTQTEEADAMGNVVLYKLTWSVVGATNNLSSNDVTAVTNIANNAVSNNAASATNKPGTIVRKATAVMRASTLKHSFKTVQGKPTGGADNVIYFYPPFYIKSSKIRQVAEKEYEASSANLTTCTNQFPNWHYHVSATTADIIPGDTLSARNSKFYLGGIPFFYFPYWTKSLKDDFGFRFYPGYNSRMGAFLKTLFMFRLNPYLKSVTHLDYRNKRGVAYGQDLVWRDTNAWSGEIGFYYLNDKDPTEKGTRSDEYLKKERYRIKFSHSQTLGERDGLLSQAQYLSDPYVVMDFFEDDYRLANQPDNYISVTHRGDAFTANLLARSRLNNFYSTVNRIPEASVTFMRQEIGDTIFYYDGQTAASFLQKTYEEGETNKQDYSAFRIDSLHMIYYPEKYFTFLNITPRAGYRATYYSETVQTATSVATNTSTSTNGTTTSTVTTNKTMIPGAADLRSMYELGLEASFKAFRTWDDALGGWRHVVEPYANYTFNPEPNLLPDNLYQFDSIDALDKEHFIKFGVRNKLQTKVDGSPYDLIDFDIYSRYLFEQGSRTTAIDNVHFELKTWPAKGVNLYFDGIYDTESSVLSKLNTRLGFKSTDFCTVALEHRYSNAGSSLLYSTISLSPNAYWTFELYGRCQFETSRLEETWLYVSKKTDCLTFRTGVGLTPGYTSETGVEKQDEWRFVFQMWINAFPDMALGDAKHNN